LFDATGASMGSLSTSPFALTPGVMQILSSLNGADVNDRSNAN